MATSLTDDNDAELNRLRVVIDNDASDGATVIQVENLSSRLRNFVGTISDLVLDIRKAHIIDHYPPSRLWDVVLSVTDYYGNKIVDEQTISDIRTAIEEMERQHLTRMNALWHDDFLASLCRNIKDQDTWDSFDLDEAIVKRKLRADLENQTPRSKCYNINLDVSKAEAVLLHWRILTECADPDKRPVFHAPFFRYFHSQEDKLPAVGSSRTENGNSGASVASNSSLHSLKGFNMYLFWGSTKDTQFSYSPSRMSSIDLMIGSCSVHVPKHYRVDERTPLNSSRYCEERCGSKMYALVTLRSLMSRDVETMVPRLWLDSGASSHMVGDITILIHREGHHHSRWFLACCREGW